MKIIYTEMEMCTYILQIWMYDRNAQALSTKRKNKRSNCSNLQSKLQNLKKSVTRLGTTKTETKTNFKPKM